MTFAALVKLAQGYADEGHQVCAIHTGQADAPDEWVYDSPSNQHGAAVIRGASRDHIVLSDGSRILLDGQVLTVNEWSAQQ